MLEHETHLALTYTARGGFFAVETDAACVRRFQPGDDAQ